MDSKPEQLIKIRYPTMHKPRRAKENIKSYSEISTLSSSEEEEEENCPTINHIKQKNSKIEKMVVMETMRSKENRYNRIRFVIVNGISKFQMKKDLSMESFFLAVDIFDRCKGIMKVEEMTNFALVATMLAMKY